MQRINQLIKEEISKILLREVDFPQNTLVTVMRVETSPDLRQAKIFISCIPENNKLKAFRILRKNLSLVQRKIGERLSIKITPKIKFIEEKKAQAVARVEELLEEIDNQNN
ncbi:30S ribosome-binding factor RbfA [Patescibacteria group bacterium]|nr:30S ribosome-binding factor RbfA [Patescibacteria group bacterium]